MCISVSDRDSDSDIVADDACERDVDRVVEVLRVVECVEKLLDAVTNDLVDREDDVLPLVEAVPSSDSDALRTKLNENVWIRVAVSV